MEWCRWKSRSPPPILFSPVLATCLRFRFLDCSISRNRSRTGDADAIEEEPLHEDEEPESDDSFDAKSRMSFSYWCVLKILCFK